MTGMSKMYFEPNEELKKQQFQDFSTTTFPAYLTAMEKRLAANSTRAYFVGDKLTTIDFALFSLIFSHIYNTENTLVAPMLKPVFEKFEHLKEYSEHLGKYFQEYLETRPKSFR